MTGEPVRSRPPRPKLDILSITDLQDAGISHAPLLQQHEAELAEISCGTETSKLTGHRLHQHIPPEDWSVTKAEFVDFVREARLAWQEERIPDSVEHPNAGHWTYKIGPSMYQVTEHFIKPITKQVGGMSWALMCNPKGHPCDLFVSHAWSEGLFEFERHLRRTWPWRANHLWCCVLANPQCGSVKELLDVPLDRCPFARALAEANYFVVLPNASSSIYNRLWCVYEISEAMSQDKSIRIPTAEPKDVIKFFFITYGRCIACGFAGVMVSLLRQIVFQTRCRLGASMLTWPLLSTVSLWRPCLHHWLAKWLIYTMFFCTGMLTGGMRRLFFFLYAAHHKSGSEKLYREEFSEDECRSSHGQHDLLDTLLEMPMMLILLFVFAAAGVYDEVYANLQEQLRHDSVFYAQCSDVHDARKIRSAIRGRESCIDSAVHTLIKAGSYNKSIEKYHSQGFRMKALRFNPGSLVLPLPAVLAMAVMFVRPGDSACTDEAQQSGSPPFLVDGGCGSETQGFVLERLVFYVLQLLLLGLFWACHFLQRDTRAEAWKCYLLLRRADQVSWMLAGAHYLLYSYDRWDLTQAYANCLEQQPHVPQKVKEFFMNTQPEIAKLLRQSFSVPLWFLFPLCDGLWNGADLGLGFSLTVILAMAFLHWQAIVGRAVLLYTNPLFLISCGSLTVLTKLAVLLRRVCKEQEWMQQRVLARRARLLSGLCLVLCDVVPHIKQLQVLVQRTSNGLLGHRHELCEVSIIMGDVMHSLAPLVSLLALIEQLWPQQDADDEAMKETLSLASPRKMSSRPHMLLETVAVSP